MLNHQGSISLKTQRLELRSFTVNDAEKMFYNWASDRDVCKYMRWNVHQNVEETRTIINNWINCYSKLSFYQWAIVLSGVNEPIGAIGLFVVNENDLTGDVGYCIGKQYWGQGIVSEAFEAVLEFAFNKIGFNRIETCHSINNPASGKVMQKVGMVFEGHARQKYKSITGFEDCKMYAILKEDFNKRN